MSSVDEARRNNGQLPTRWDHYSIDTSQLSKLDTLLMGTDKAKTTHIRPC